MQMTTVVLMVKSWLCVTHITSLRGIENACLISKPYITTSRVPGDLTVADNTGILFMRAMAISGNFSAILKGIFRPITPHTVIVNEVDALSKESFRNWVATCNRVDPIRHAT